MEAPDRVAIRHVGWLLVGVFGLAACITLVFLGMRAVMDIGGACADGGPYVSAQPCPDGVGLIMSLAFPLGFAFAGVIAWAGGRIGGWYGAIGLLAWPALFLSLAWNFLEYGLFAPPPEAGGIVWGWLIPGVLFIAMGLGPLLLVLWGARESRAFEPRRYGLPDLRQDSSSPTFDRWWTRVPGARGQPSRRSSSATGADARAAGSGGRASTGASAGARSASVSTSSPPASQAVGSASPAGRAVRDAGAISEAEAAVDDALVDQLERLARLHESGALTDEEFAAAKQAVLLGEGGSA